MPTTHDAHRLMAEAAKATTLAESSRLVNEAQAIRAAAAREAAADRELDFADAIVRDHLVPVRVHEHHTAATDWLGSIDTGHDLREAEHEILAQASLWYGKTAAMVKEFPEEFSEQALGRARKLAGAYGEQADEAEQLFLSHVTALHEREIKSGTVKVADAQLPQATTPQAGGYPAEVFPTGNYQSALPGEATTSERAPQLVELGGAPSSGASDVTPENDPGLGVTNSTADQDNGDANTFRSASKKKGASMQHAQCPTCGGHGRVAVRTVKANSGLDQIQQTVAPNDEDLRPTPLPPEVAWPITYDPNAIPAAIAQTEQQVSERNAKSPLIQQKAQRAVQQKAQRAANAAYRRVLAGQDDSGWAGDMGAGGVAPGQQDGGNPPSSNLGQPDPVYGYGGDQADHAVKPYGAAEADDYTNNPGQNWQPGQPTQMDLGGRVMDTGAPTTYQQGPNSGAPKAAAYDPEIAKAQRFIAQREAFLRSQGR